MSLPQINDIVWVIKAPIECQNYGVDVTFPRKQKITRIDPRGNFYLACDFSDDTRLSDESCSSSCWVTKDECYYHANSAFKRFIEITKIKIKDLESQIAIAETNILMNK